MKKMTNICNRAVVRVAKAERKVAKAEAKLSKAEAKLEAKRAKVMAAKKIYQAALAEAEQYGAYHSAETSTP